MKRRCRSKKAKRGTYVSKKSGQTCRYRSNWERLYLEHLDSESNVLTYTYEPFFIHYVSNVRTGKLRKYIPDVLVTFIDSSQHLVEIKPKSRLSKRTVVKKIAAAQNWCLEHGLTYVIVTEHDLKSLGLL